MCHMGVYCICIIDGFIIIMYKYLWKQYHNKLLLLYINWGNNQEHVT